jgi:hypothetical protein
MALRARQLHVYRLARPTMCVAYGLLQQLRVAHTRVRMATNENEAIHAQHALAAAPSRWWYTRLPRLAAHTPPLVPASPALHPSPPCTAVHCSIPNRLGLLLASVPQPYRHTHTHTRSHTRPHSDCRIERAGCCAMSAPCSATRAPAWRVPTRHSGTRASGGP